MSSITKQQFLDLLDKKLPDDCTIVAYHQNGGAAIEIDDDFLDALVMSYEDAFDIVDEVDIEADVYLFV